MKALKYLAITLAIVAVLAIGGWVLRDALIQRISDPLLSDYDVELVDVSLDALGTNNASISYLELAHTNGTRIVIEGLTLAVRADENDLRIYLADKVEIITTTPDDGATVEIARMIDQFLSLTNLLPNNEFNVDEFHLTSYPTVRDLKWTVAESKQALSGMVESVAFLASATRNAPTSYDVVLSLPGKPGSGDPADNADGKLRQTDQGISIIGNPALDLPGWETITKMLGIVPEAVEIQAGTAELQYDIQIPYDVAQLASLTAELHPTSALRIGYREGASEATNVLFDESGAIRIDATFPRGEWTLRLDNASTHVTNGAWREFPLSIGDLSCKSGPACSMQASISWLNADIPIGQVQKIEMFSVLDVSSPEKGVRIDVRSGATLELTGLSSPANAIGQLKLHSISPAAMQYSDGGWSFSAESIDASTESLSLNDDIVIDAPIFLERFEVSENAGAVAINTGVFIPAFNAAMNDQVVALPGVKGQVSLDNEQVEFDLATIDLLRDGTIEGRHSFENESGEIRVDLVALTFDGASLSTRVAPWANDWDISAGTVALDFYVRWDRSDPDNEVTANASIGLEGLSGFYTDTAFAGLSTAIDIEYGGDDGLLVDPTEISVALIEMGLPIENLTADVALDINNLATDVENLQMTAFNGVISAEPFSFHTGSDANNITLTATGIELAELLAIKEFAAIDVTGTIAAVLPITIESDGVSINGGVLTGEPPGGVIRYLAGGNPDETDTSAIGLATEALSNFEYESLTSDVTYSKDGNLILQMQIKGRNPEMAESRPVVLNLGVENNVIQMLRSLQAARAVEEILEKRLAE